MINMKRGHVDIIDKEGEVWKDVIGYEGYYKISNFGRIMTVRRIANITKFGKATTMIINQRLGAITINKQGYPCAILTINGNTKRCLIHRVLAQAFIPNPENKPLVNHIDGNKRNNNYKNLEWCTASENTIHALKTGLLKIRYGKSAGGYFTFEEAEEIRKFREKTGFSHKKIAQIYETTRSVITNILLNKNYTQ